jgi:hypothetical protein
MDYMDTDEERRRRELHKAEAETAKLEQRLAELRRKARSARSRLKSTTRHETWHARRLAAQDRQAGYDGEMAEARHYVRWLPMSAYVRALQPFAEANPNTSVVELEVMAVQANLDDWTTAGKGLLLDLARARYADECRTFEAWLKDHPGEKDWRDKPATRAQWMLIWRTVEALKLNDRPERLTRGQAHDWLQEHGANVRLRNPDRPGEGEKPEGTLL